MILPTTKNTDLIVIKLGSSVLTDVKTIPKAVHEVYQYLRQGVKVLVVVSAIGNTTNELITKAKLILDDPSIGDSTAAFAELLATGETTAASLFSMGLDRAGIKAKTLSHSFLKTQGSILNAEPKALNHELIIHLFKQYSVLVIPGFIGHDDDAQVTLLGRGGSDYTAIFAAWALNADACVIYKDTSGIFDKDPNLYANTAKCYASIHYQDCLKLDYPVIQFSALKFAQDNNFNFTVKSLKQKSGTQVGAFKSKISSNNYRQNKLNVILLGLGTVGFGVYKNILANNHLFNLVGVCVKDIKKHKIHNISAEIISEDIDEIIGRKCDVVIELIGGISIAEKAITYSLNKRHHVISANKALIAEKGLALSELAANNGVTFSYSAAVAGAIPILETLSHFKKNKPLNYIRSVTGIVNGTCNFILDKIIEGKTFSDAITLAQNMGFAEADPSLDINGYDSAQKISIISRIAFGKEPDSLHVNGIQNIDEKYIHDERIKGNIVRLIASCEKTADGIHANVQPLALATEHPFAKIADENNAILIQTIENELIPLYGKGAGRWPTAEAVFADLLELSQTSQHDFLCEANKQQPKQAGVIPYESLDTVGEF